MTECCQVFLANIEASMTVKVFRKTVAVSLEKSTSLFPYKLNKVFFFKQIHMITSKLICYISTLLVQVKDAGLAHIINRSLTSGC